MWYVMRKIGRSCYQHVITKVSGKEMYMAFGTRELAEGYRQELIQKEKFPGYNYLGEPEHVPPNLFIVVKGKEKDIETFSLFGDAPDAD